MVTSDIMWLTSIFVVVAGVTLAGAILFLAHYKKPKKKKKQSVDRMASLNMQIREGLRMGSDAPDHVIHAIATTRAWVHKERLKGYTDLALAEALCNNGWEPDVARQLVTSTQIEEGRGIGGII